MPKTNDKILNQPQFEAIYSAAASLNNVCAKLVVTFPGDAYDILFSEGRDGQVSIIERRPSEVTIAREDYNSQVDFIESYIKEFA